MWRMPISWASRNRQYAASGAAASCMSYAQGFDVVVWLAIWLPNS